MLKFSQRAILIALLASSALAQTRTNGFGRVGSFGRSAGRMVIAREHRAFNPAYGYYGTPYFYGDYYEPYDLQYPAPAPEAPPATPVKAEPLPDPMLLELRGNQWVRVTNFAESSNRAVAPESPVEEPAQVKPLPPAVLVFHDGHTEEVSSYSIIGGSIYTKANYWTTGAWTRTVAIADLDIPATLERNQKRGVNFELPSGPDEVMIRP